MVVVGRDGLSIEAQRNATITFMALLRASLASKRVLKVGCAGGAQSLGGHPRMREAVRLLGPKECACLRNGRP